MLKPRGKSKKINGERKGKIDEKLSFLVHTHNFDWQNVIGWTGDELGWVKVRSDSVRVCKKGCRIFLNKCDNGYIVI